jgi:ABC-type Fe3+/spermidine/putrescine transport system ATPase subunit
VAEFIGKTNIVDGVAESPETIRRGGLRLTVASAAWKAGAAATVSIRPHLIELVPAGASASASGDTIGALRGTVRRASYLGEAVDYQVEVEDGGPTLRVWGPSIRRFRAGDAVLLRVPSAACVPLADDRPAPGV